MLYHPKGRYVWDTWYFEHAGRLHVIHLQMRRPGTELPEDEQCTLGHAASADLLHWEELPLALRRGEPGAYDDGFLFTGSCVEHEGTNYLFYSSNRRDPGQGRTLSGMCLATSRDHLHWQKHPANPVLVPDPRWYFTRDDPPPAHLYMNRPDVDCRDMLVLKDPAGPGWLGYTIMRRKTEHLFDSCCVALCRSPDLVRWEVGPPCCTPERFLCFEVPDVFELQGRWYMTALTGDVYGHRRRWADPYARYGTIVFEADNPCGPFHEVEGNLLLASEEWEGFSARSALWQGERVMFFSHREHGDDANNFGRLSWPLRLVPRELGGLLPMWRPANAAAFTTQERLPPASSAATHGWCIDPLARWDAPPEGLMAEGRITCGSARAAGFAIGPRGDQFWPPVLLALLDPVHQEVVLLQNPGFRPVQRRRWTVRPDAPHHLRVTFVDRMAMVFVDDVLALNAHVPQVTPEGLGLYAEDGAASLCDAAVHRA